MSTFAKHFTVIFYTLCVAALLCALVYRLPIFVHHSFIYFCIGPVSYGVGLLFTYAKMKIFHS